MFTYALARGLCLSLFKDDLPEYTCILQPKDWEVLDQNTFNANIVSLSINKIVNRRDTDKTI